MTCLLSHTLDAMKRYIVSRARSLLSLAQPRVSNLRSLRRLLLPIGASSLFGSIGEVCSEPNFFAVGSRCYESAASSHTASLLLKPCTTEALGSKRGVVFDACPGPRPQPRVPGRITYQTLINLHYQRLCGAGLRTCGCRENV